MIQNIPVAVVLATAASFSFAMAARVQHSAVATQVSENRAKRRLSFAQLGRLIRDARWWAGTGLLAASWIGQFLALWLAPVSVVQPVGLLAFPWSILLARKALGTRPVRTIVATAVTVAATAGFIIIVSTYADLPARQLNLVWIGVAAGLVYALAGSFALLGSHGRRRWRCLFWASGGALFFGLESSVVRALFVYAASHDWWRDPLVWGTVGVLVAGSVIASLMIQQGYATGPAPVVVASMTVTSPVVAVMFGTLVLGEGARLAWQPTLALACLGAVAVAGVVVLARAQTAADHHGA